jgi:hypothetical protein
MRLSSASPINLPHDPLRPLYRSGDHGFGPRAGPLLDPSTNRSLFFWEIQVFMTRGNQGTDDVWIVMMKAIRALTRYATAGIEATGLGLSDFGVLEVPAAQWAFARQYGSLNCYDRTKIPGSILKIEKVNFDGPEQIELFGYAISAKRYVLYRYDLRATW